MTQVKEAVSPPGAFFVPHNLDAPITGSAAGPLLGLTAAIKDMYDIAGTRTGGGNPDWLARQKPAKQNASAIEKILAAGASIAGKAICEEFFFSITGANVHYGTPANVRAPGRLPGGSSSGSAAAVAAGACDFALGSDTGGSVRVPAAFCGIYGIRPTHGRVSLAGAMPMSDTFDTAGWFAASPGVFRNIGGVLLEGERADADIARVLIPDDALATLDAGMAAFFRGATTRVARLMPSPQRLTIAPEGLLAWSECVRILQAREIWTVYAAFMTDAKPALGPGIKERFDFAATVTEEAAWKARETLSGIRRHLRAIVTPGTVLMLPTTPTIAPKVDAAQDELNAFRLNAMQMTCIAGLGGLPQVSLPFGTVEGCPAGLSLIGWPGADETLLDLAVNLGPACGAVRI